MNIQTSQAMIEQRYECKLFKARDELASFMNTQLAKGWMVKEHSVILRGDETATLLLSVVFERPLHTGKSSKDG
jgi:hypothetical protein